MNKKVLEINGIKVAVLDSKEPVITDGQSALDLLATIHYEDDCGRIAIQKEAITEDFFKLSSGVAGEVLQKVVNYRKKLAIFGDFTAYTSKPLHDFMYECNRGKDVFFVKTEQEAVDKLAG